ncbi:glutamate-1-semialdehyde 2,1-aminomutase [Antricoccus suffuscus]|uniref:Glutamate-1-semialdehyde 2,1-aminomutase n=1 Tax=Antricoccus suffuscus TaxID=1629062 RepID=A0A2T1A0Z8_9ACTN|nr:aminotransferase class III-fold pyridoxal phosphate-dependent enzyme [Antricoccus suffuscus]PRZ42279.1 glutamate-1-semialdehyde 2,1-aminomutase [Antricoccus suffuscus]
MTAPTVSHDQDHALRERAKTVLPGGMYGHMSMRRMPDGFPQFMARGKGSRLWDTDGNEYIDFMCGWGPIVLGRQDPIVEAAAAKQMAEGDCLNGPGPIMVELAELLCDTIPHADWAMMAKNGTDATTACVTTARAATGRRKILIAGGAYHGAIPWCTPLTGGVIAEDRAHLDYFEYNDIESLRKAVDAAGDDLAGIIISPVRQELARTQEPATREFAQECRTLCTKTGAVLILDDVRCGFRIDLAGSWNSLGVQPDLAAWSKAIANGYALSAVTGRESLREATQTMYVTGSFWYSTVAMAAAVATITQLRETDALGRMRAAGEQWRAGLLTLAASHGLTVEHSGPVQMPLLQFQGDVDSKLAFTWANEAVKRGVYVHPIHNGFVSAAHTPADVDEALDRIDGAFATVAASI